MQFGLADVVKTEATRNKVEENSVLIDDIVSDIIKPYCKDLDDYILFIKSILNNGKDVPTDIELDDFCLNLSTDLYFASSMCEHLGIRDDISKAVWKDIYNRERDKQSGTVADKNTLAELASQEEQLTNLIYARAYKVMKAKVESAQELLASCKKILSHRMQQTELSNFHVRDNMTTERR